MSRSQSDKGNDKRQPQIASPRFRYSLYPEQQIETTVKQGCESLQSQQYYKPLMHSGATSSLALAMIGSVEAEKEKSQTSGKETEEGREEHEKNTVTEQETRQSLPTTPDSLNALSWNAPGSFTSPHTLSEVQLNPFLPANILTPNPRSWHQQMLSLEQQAPYPHSGSQIAPPFQGGVAFYCSAGASVRFIPPPLLLPSIASSPPPVITPTDSNCSDPETCAQHTLEMVRLSPKPSTEELDNVETESKVPVTDQETKQEAVAISENSKGHISDYKSHSKTDKTDGGKEDTLFDHNEFVKENVSISQWGRRENDEEKIETADSLPDDKDGRRRRRRCKRPRGVKGMRKQSAEKRQTVRSRGSLTKEEGSALFEAPWIPKQEQNTEKPVQQTSSEANASQQRTTTIKIKRHYGVPDLYYSPRPSSSRSKNIDNQSTPFKVDDVVWAKLVDRPWWPARVASFIKDEADSKQTMLMVSVKWLGRPSNFTDVLPSSLISPFAETFHKYFMPEKKYRTYVRAIEEALQVSGFNPNLVIPETEMVK